MADDKNRREHEFVVSFMRDVFGRNCYNVSIPRNPSIKALRHVQHLCTPVSAQVMEGRSLLSLASQLHPTPALSGTPVGEAMMTLREAESYNRGFLAVPLGMLMARVTENFPWRFALECLMVKLVGFMQDVGLWKEVMLAMSLTRSILN